MNVKYLYIILAIALMLCLLPMPYGYYTFIRFVAMSSFGYFAYKQYQKQESLTFVFSALALLFQPFIKLSLGRGLWNFVDVVVSIMLIICYFRKI